MRAAQLQQAAELLDAILREPLPADRQIDLYFRKHRQMGARDRAWVAETVYGCLRRRRTLEHILSGDRVDAFALVAAHALLAGASARALEEAGFRGDPRTLAARVRTLDPTILPFAVRHDLPDWLAERLIAGYGEAGAAAIADALNSPAPVDLRVNTLKTTREALQAQLVAEGHPNEPTPYSPVGLRRRERAPLFATPAFQAGEFEIQDEGSQLIALLLEPRRRERVVDFCAGSGGKTLHLGALMANTGTIYAFDVSAARLERLKPRLKRAGLDTVRVQAIENERDLRVQRLRGKIDRVLVDAPCSGTGTLRRNPDIKWRPIDLAALVDTQKRILAAAATLVKPGGRLVYATCSLLREENDEVVAAFLVTHPQFVAVSAAEILARRHVPLVTNEGALRLDPASHGTDGFYAIALERREDAQT